MGGSSQNNISYTSTNQTGSPYSNAYNFAWRNHPLGFQGHMGATTSKKSNPEMLMENFPIAQTK